MFKKIKSIQIRTQRGVIQFNKKLLHAQKIIFKKQVYILSLYAVKKAKLNSMQVCQYLVLALLLNMLFKKSSIARLHSTL